MEALNCPNCGAPLPNPGERRLVVCLYCASVVRLQLDGPQPKGAVEQTIAEDEMDAIKAMLLKGERSQAVQAYQRITSAELSEAETVMDVLAKDLSMNTIRRQQLTGYGLLLTCLSGAAVIVILIAWLVGMLALGWALLLIALPAFNLLFVGPSLRVTFHYLFAPIAPAVTLKIAHIGIFNTTKMDIHTYRVWLEVQPIDRPPFRTELVLPVKDESLWKLRPGTRFQVKYLPGKPDQVLFDRTLDAV